MSKFRDTSSGDVIDVPDVLDASYEARPEYVKLGPSTADAVDPGTAPGEGGDGFDPKAPLSAGLEVALANVASIKGTALDEALVELSLETSGTADEKRDRLAARLTTEVQV